VESINLQKLKYSIFNPFIKDVAGLEKFKADVKAALGQDKAAEARVKTKMFEAMGMFILAAKDYDIPGFEQKNYPSLTAGRRAATIVANYNSYNDELTQDTLWMSAFRFTGTNAASIDIIDFTSAIVIKELADAEPIPLTQYGSDLKSNLKEKRWGSGIAFLNRWLETNELYQINDAVVALRIKFFDNKTTKAYAALGNTAYTTYTTTSAAATVDAVITAINTGAKTLLKRMSGKGFGVGVNAPLQGYCSMDHEDLVAQAFAKTRGTSGDNNVIRRVINMNFTFNSNFPVQFQSKNALRLVFPGGKNLFVDFKAHAEKSEMDFKTDSTALYAQEYWNLQTSEDQIQTVNLQA
jgi:hypothetical protein